MENSKEIAEDKKTDHVFRREACEDDKIISAHFYNFIIGITLFWGFAVNYFIVRTVNPYYLLQNMNIYVFILGYFALCFGGSFIMKKSKNPAVSFLGYNMIVVPFGLVINIVVSQYAPEIVMQAILYTGVVTGIMMCLGTMFPAFFASIARSLSISLIIVVIIEVLGIVFLKQTFNIIDWAVVFIFCGYIGLDWGRANQIPKTLDNAVDSAAAIYIDIINMFLRILRILGRKK